MGSSTEGPRGTVRAMASLCVCVLCAGWATRHGGMTQHTPEGVKVPMPMPFHPAVATRDPSARSHPRRGPGPGSSGICTCRVPRTSF
eukprot:1244527-Pyramimonas_sp.AAC.1